MRDPFATGGPSSARCAGYTWGGEQPLLRLQSHQRSDAGIPHSYAHPRPVGLTGEVEGGNVRLSEMEAIVNRRNPDAETEELTITNKRRYQWNFIRALG